MDITLDIDDFGPPSRMSYYYLTVRLTRESKDHYLATCPTLPQFRTYRSRIKQHILDYLELSLQKIIPRFSNSAYLIYRTRQQTATHKSRNPEFNCSYLLNIEQPDNNNFMSFSFRLFPSDIVSYAATMGITLLYRVL